MSQTESQDRLKVMNGDFIRRMGIAVFALGLQLTLVGCGDWGLETDRLRDIDGNRELWERQGLDTYRYAVERLCFCGLAGPVRVTVVDGDATERVFVQSGDPVPEDQADWYPTVDELFSILVDAVQRNAHDIEVTYDPDTGVPLDIFIDYEQNVADEELGFRVTEVPGPAA
ncbi:MAG: hypothetical protein KJO65_09165 [Gemmatimonadetes bacterium]|nr:hypothetical protein [Gemmatimonadota bacterium]